MLLVKRQINLGDLKKMAESGFGDMVKAVVDVEKGVMVVDAEMHADEEKFLLEKGSGQDNLWGINLYPELEEDEWIEFDSMINLRPTQGNMSRRVEDEGVQERIVEIVKSLVVR